MNKDQPLDKCGRCGAKDRFVFEILFRKPFYTCKGILPNGTSICNRSTEISKNPATTDIGRNVEALIAQKTKNASLTVESPYWKEAPAEPETPPQPVPTETTEVATGTGVVAE